MQRSSTHPNRDAVESRVIGIRAVLERDRSERVELRLPERVAVGAGKNVVRPTVAELIFEIGH